MSYARYAIYYAPGGALADFGARWLGWDMETGLERTDDALHERLPMLDKATARPRKYGFHATLKAPFRLATGESVASLESALEAFAAEAIPAASGPLEVAALGQFLALRPTGKTDALNAQAFEIVQLFDRFRAPLSEDDLARRRASELSDAQDALLVAWGYPFVGPEFRLHLTLTGPVTEEERAVLQPVLTDLTAPHCAQPFVLDRIALVGERSSDGRFEMLRAFELGA